MGNTVSMNPYLALLPELLLLSLIAIVLILDLVFRDKDTRFLGWLSAGGLAVIIAISVIFCLPPAEPQLIFGGMLRLDLAGFVFRMIFLTAALVTSLFVVSDKDLGDLGEVYLLVMVSSLGMSLMASSADLIMLFLAIETTSIPLYVLAGFLIWDQRSVESGVKYLLYGAMTSAVMLFSFSLLYGFTGTTQIYSIAENLRTAELPVFSVVTVLLLIMVGFGFKISAVPFHFWAPDVYEGAPTPVAGFLSTASKAAGFAVILRFVLLVFPEISGIWVIIAAVMASLSMFLGNFLAMAQKNIKRLLAYSSIAHAGYILIGVAAGGEFGGTAAIYYLLAYLVTNLTAFGVVEIIGRAVGSDDISAYAGLSRRSPSLALILLISILSLGGIPPFAGFFAKLLVLGAAVKVNLVPLALIGILNAILALYYYLNVLKVVYLYRSESEKDPLQVSLSWKIGLGVGVTGILVIGIVMNPWFIWSTQAALALLSH